MTAFALARTTALLTAVLAPGCATGPDLPRAVTVVAGKPVRVLLRQGKDGLVFVLQNASSTTAADFYDGDMPPLAKIAPDDQVQMLLDILADKGMFAAAEPAPADARDLLVVEQGDRRWSWARRRGAPAAEQTAFLEARGYFLAVYNESLAYHPADAEHRPDLMAERDRMRREAEATRRRLQRSPGDQP
ncbi:MAG: hypothetical protein KF830_01690 [Planctomycetes bacterium]|nr:hypothetical protein [Planctomycetota bacterium]